MNTSDPAFWLLLAGICWLVIPLILWGGLVIFLVTCKPKKQPKRSGWIYGSQSD